MYKAKYEDVFIYFGKDKTKRHKLDAIKNSVIYAMIQQKYAHPIPERGKDRLFALDRETSPCDVKVVHF